MKKLLLTCIVFSLSLVVAKAQYTADTITFDDTSSRLVHIDTSQHPNIWEIGRPQKVYLDSAYSKPNAIITDTVNPYPDSNISSFTIGFNTYFSGVQCPYFSFWQKYETDSLHAGGYIQISTDTGKTWTNISSIAPNTSVYDYDTITGGIPAFTGKSYGWKNVSLYFCFYSIVYGNDSVLLKFTFKSDSVATGEDGWEIDNIMFGIVTCEGIQEINKNAANITIYPNPASNEVNLIYKLPASSRHAVLNLYNPLGQLVKSQNISGNAGTLTQDVSGLKGGIYYYRLMANGAIAAVGKLVIIK